MFNMGEFFNKDIIEDKSGAVLRGRFYYSKKQLVVEMNKGEYKKKYCKLDISNEIREYTEMVNWDEDATDPYNYPLFDDAVFLGDGRFYGWSGRTY